MGQTTAPLPPNLQAQARNEPTARLLSTVSLNDLATSGTEVVMIV